MERWLEIVEESFPRTLTEGDEHLARSFREKRGEIGIPGNSLAPTLAWSGTLVHEAPKEIQEILRRPQITGSLDARSERLQSVSLQVFDACLTRVHYHLSGRNGFVDVQSWDHRVHENVESTEPLRHRLRWMKTSALLAVIMGLALTAWFGARHPFYMASSHLLWLGGLGLLLPLVILPLMAALALPRGSMSSGLLASVSLPVAFVLFAQIALAATGRPSFEHAEALAQAGHTEEARLEAAACADLGVDGLSAKAFHDQLQLAQLETLRDPEQVWKATEELPFYTSEGRRQAKEHALSVSLQEVAARQTEGEFDTGKTRLNQIPARYSEDPRVRKLWLRDDLYRAQSLWTAIRSSEPLESRLQACEDIQPFLPSLESADEPAPSKSRVEAQCASLDRERLREIARRQREIERQREAEERERRRAQRAAEAAARAWANAPLLCRDGSPSPTCVCGQSSRRGCCSHHGGVAGCTVDWPGIP